MKIYINNVEVKCQIMPVNKPTLDETLETFTFSLISNQDSEPYKPMTSVIFESDNHEKTAFVLTNDNVELSSLKPVLYKHTITCTEAIRELSKHLIRNSQFTQPFNNEKISNNFVTFSLGDRTSSGSGDYGHLEYLTGIDTTFLRSPHYNTIRLGDKEKVSKVFVKLNAQVVETGQQVSGVDTGWTGQFVEYHSFNEILQTLRDNYGGASATFTSSFEFRYTDSNNTVYTDTISGSDLEGVNTLRSMEFGVKYRCPKIENLAQQGYNNFMILFPINSTDFISGSVYPYNDSKNICFIFVELDIIAEVYYYTALDVMELINKRHLQKYEVEFLKTGQDSSLLNVQKNEPLWEYDDDTRSVLENKITPNLTFTQLTAFDCVAEVFRLFDAIFTTKVDSNGDPSKELSIEYFNDWSAEKITPKFSGINSVIAEDYYTNGLVTYYQDGAVDFESMYQHSTTTKLGIPDDGDHILELPFPIEVINDVDMKLSDPYFRINFRGAGGPIQIRITSGDFVIDFTPYVVEQSLWTILDQATYIGSHSVWEVVQNNSVYYSKNSNYIDLSYTYKYVAGVTAGSFYTSILAAFYRTLGLESYDSTNMMIPFGGSGGSVTKVNLWALMMKVKYRTSIDGRTKIESLNDKYKGETLVDQYNGAVDLNKMGLNMFGLALKMGEPTMFANHLITKWSKRIKTGQIYVKDGAYWIANVCSYTPLPNGYLQGSVSFVKNFNSLALYTSIDRQKRLSNISSELTLKSEDNIVDYLYFSTADTKPTIATEPICIDSTCIMNNFASTFEKEDVDDEDYHTQQLQVAIIKTDTVSDYLVVPLVKYGAGNSICFEMQFNTSNTAGNLMSYHSDNTWFGADQFFTEPVWYTDKDGFFDKATIYFVPEHDCVNYPITTYNGWYGGIIKNLEIYKQPNETFALNYELCLLPYNIQKDFVMPKFVNENLFTLGSYRKTNLYLYWSIDYEYSQLDNKAVGDRVAILSVGRTDNGDGSFDIKFYPTGYVATVKHWAIGDDQGNIYFASNNTHTYNPNDASFTIRFYPRQHRL